MKKFLIFLPILVLIASCAGVAETETGTSSTEASTEASSTEAIIDTNADPDEQIAALQTEITSLNAELSSLRQATPQQTFDKSATEAYKQAYELYRKAKYAEGIGKFEEFISKWPASDLADNAQYWIGECYYSMRDWTKALTAFQKVLSYPTGNKMSDATLKMGYTYNEMARENFNAVIKQYPRSNAARLAKRKLN
jgi:tol-pal system protein YbgF